MRDFVEHMVRRLVDDQDAVKVVEFAGEQNTIIEVTVAKIDFGKVIGKVGKHAEAIRTLVTGATKSSKRNIRVSFIDPG